MRTATRGRSCGSGSEGGSVAAELALALPAVVLVLVIGVGALGAAAHQVALQDAAADAARLLGRGEDEGSAAHAVASALPGAAMSTTASGDLVCVTTRIEVGIAGFLRWGLRAHSCALGGGR